MTENQLLPKLAGYIQQRRFLLLSLSWLTFILMTSWVIYAGNILTVSQGCKTIPIQKQAKLFVNKSSEYNNATNTITTREFNVQRRRLTKTDYPLTVDAPFLIDNPQICEGTVTVLIIVHTAMMHFEQRMLLRTTIANRNLFKERYAVRIAFLMGTSRSEEVNKLVKQENEDFHDIVQGDFEDTYKNLTLKGVMGFRWILHHCPHAEIVLKMDDDVYVDIFQFVRYFQPRFAKKPKLIACNVMFPSPVLRGSSRWSIDADYFRFVENYPAYCSGFLVIMTVDTIKALHAAARITPFFWIDDVYLFGLLPAISKIHHDTIGQHLTLNTPRCMQLFSRGRNENPLVLACLASRSYEYDFFWRRSLKTLDDDMTSIVPGNIIDDMFSRQWNGDVRYFGKTRENMNKDKNMGLDINDGGLILPESPKSNVLHVSKQRDRFVKIS